MNKLNVAVLFGGKSPEHDVSLQSGKAIMSALSERPDKYTVLPVYVTNEGRWVMDFFGEMPVDVVFPALHGKNGEDGSVQGVCVLADVPCVGSGILASAVCMDKPMSKKLAAGIKGLAQVEFVEFCAGEDFDVVARKVKDNVGYPCFCKPVKAGSSRGISKVFDKEGLAAAFGEAAAHDSRIIVERAVTGRELEVGILGNDKPIASPVGEIVTDRPFYDYEAKYTEGAAQVLIPAPLDRDVEAAARALALEIYRVMGCAGMARVDFFLEDKTERLIFNEVNTIPGFTPTSMYPKLFAHMGLSLADLADKLVDFSLVDFSIEGLSR